MGGFAYGSASVALTGDVPDDVVLSGRLNAEPAHVTSRAAAELLSYQMT